MFAAQVEALATITASSPDESICQACRSSLVQFGNGVTLFPRWTQRPAQVDPEKIVAAIQGKGDAGFGSPAIWNRIGRYRQPGDHVPMRCVFRQDAGSCGCCRA
jgi:hypothetical protein